MFNRFSWRGRRIGHLLATLAPFLSAACSNASPDETGGQLRFDPTPTVDAGADCGDPNADAGSGAGWNDLYRDYFGSSAVSGCAGTAGSCHGAAADLGAQASDFTCGSTAAECYAGITSGGAGLLTVGDTTDDPKTSGLYEVLRKECIGGEMPKAPATFAFTPADMKRIAAWIGAGAPAPTN